MPTYDYRCNACGHEFELFQSMTAPVQRKCPACGKLRLERLIGTGAGVIFKGGGFYETDYRSDAYTKAAEAEKKAAEGKTTDGASTASSAGETKAADAPPSKEATATKAEAPGAKAPKSSATAKTAPAGPSKPAGAGGGTRVGTTGSAKKKSSARGRRR